MWESRVRYDSDDMLFATPTVDIINHPRVVVVSADCDLLKDFGNRVDGKVVRVAHALPHILLCDLYSSDELVPVLPTAFGGKEMAKVDGNQHERYHCLPEAAVETTTTIVPKLYLDFKKCFGLPPEHIYHSIGHGVLTRIGCIGPVFLQDLTHRLYGFLSRVGPEFN